MNWLRCVVFVCTSVLLCSAAVAQNEVSVQMQIAQNAIQMLPQEGYERAIEYLESKGSDFNKDNDLDQLLYNWTLGLLHFNAGKYDIAKAPLTTTVEICERNIPDVLTRDCEPFLRAYYWLAQVDWFTNFDIDQYWTRLSRAKEIYESAGLTDTEFYTAIHAQYENQQSGVNDKIVSAYNFALSDNWEAAVPLFEELKTFIEQKGAKDNTYYALCYSLSQGYVKTDRLESAETLLVQVLDELNISGNCNAEIYRMLLDNLGAVYYSLRNYQKSNEAHQQAKILYEKNLDYGDNYVRCLMNCAGAQRESGYKSIAKMLVDTAIRQARANLDDTSQISSCTNILGSLSNEQEHTYSEEEVQAIKIKPFITFLTNAGAIYSDLDYNHEALSVLRETIDYSEKIGIKDPYLFQNLGDIYASNSHYEESAEWMKKAFECPLSSLDHLFIGYDYVWSKYLCRDDEVASLATKLSQELCVAISTTFSFMSDEQRKQLWSSYSHYLPTLDAIIIEEGDNTMYSQIYDNTLYSKGLLLRTANQVRASVLSSGDETLIKEFAKLEQLKGQEVSETDTGKRSALQNDIESLEKSLIKSVRSFGEFSEANSITWTKVQATLGASDLAIEFCRLPIYRRADKWSDMRKDYCYYALCLKHGYEYPHLVSLCKESQLETLDSEVVYNTDSLYNLVWRPLLSELKGVENIYFAADRFLHKTGIEYALMPDSSQISSRYNLFRLSSTRTLAEKPKANKIETAVLYGGLRYDLDRDELIAESRSIDYHSKEIASRALVPENLRYGVKYLPGTLDEVNDIAKDFQQQPCVLTDAAGTEESFKALSGTSVDIIHLATHGFFWNDDMAEEHNYVNFLSRNKDSKQSIEDKALLRSGLFFSGANIGLSGEELPQDVEDGVLTAQEISAMNLGNVNLVVMSACESGLGETSGEGVFGLQRGFKLAGAKSLLMSLWKVDDEATKVLMTEFYRSFLDGKSKTESLRLAQKYVKSQPGWQDPKYWAGFILLDALD